MTGRLIFFLAFPLSVACRLVFPHPALATPTAPPPAPQSPSSAWVDRASYEPAEPEDQGPAGDAPIEPPPSGYRYPDDFPLPAPLKANVEFWKKVYGEYTKSQVVFHDTDNLSILYGYLDFSEIEQRNISEGEKQRLKELECSHTERWIQGILRDLSSGWPGSRTLSEDHARIAAMFGPDAHPSDFYQASHEERVRWQTGLKDRFLEGLALAGRYLPHIERVFLEEGLPIELSRLPFVESLFVCRARSKVGAVGIWQFMPATGRLYLQMNGAVDERMDPILAARGASKLLADNFRVLGNWPLALTAYNHGRAGMARAAEMLGTRDLGVIAEDYRSPSFGFASRNFYSEFLAALYTYENRAEIFGSVRADEPLAFDEVSLDAFVSVAAAGRNLDLAVDTLKPLNPAISDEVWRGRLDLPAGYRLRIPRGQRQAFLAAWERMPASDKHASQRGPSYDTHRVKKGETLASIASDYGVSREALRRLNRFGGKKAPRVGSTIRVPAGTEPLTASGRGSDGGARRVATAAAGTTPVSGASVRPGNSRTETHTVRAGDTPGEIAEKYGMIPSELMRQNGIPDAKSLKPGQILKVKAQASFLAPSAAEKRRPAVKEPSAHQYVVRDGDSLYEIAKAHNTSVRALQAENRLGRALLIHPGQTLRIPD